MSAADLLQWLNNAQKTGTLVFTSPGVTKRVFFADGRIIASASTDPREYLGQFLMSYGYISEDELKKAMEVQAQSRILLGKILLMIEAITEEHLLRLMRLKVEEEIYDVFLWPDGDFHFVDDEIPTMEMVPLHIDVTGISLEGSRRVDEWKRIKEIIPNGQMVPVVEKTIDQEDLSEAQRMVIQAINGQRSIEEIVLESRSSSFNVSRAIVGFVLNGTIRLVQKTAPQPRDIAPIEFEIESEGEINSLVKRAQNLLQADEFQKSLRMLQAAQNIDPENVKVRAALQGAETFILSQLKKDGISEAKIPRLIKDLADVSNLGLTPSEGFILSRVNGLWDIGSIVKISPMREIDALLIFRRLVSESVVELTG